jgi:hypothetical protein
MEQRRFVLRNLRDFGFGRKTMEALIHEEIEELMTTFRKEIGKPISTQHKFTTGALFPVAMKA